MTTAAKAVARPGGGQPLSTTPVSSRSSESRPITVAVFTNGHEYTVRHRLPLLRHLEGLGWSVVGVAPAGSQAAATFAEMRFCVTTVTLSRSGANPFRELLALWSVWRAYRRIKPSVVVHATVKPVLYGTLIASWLDIPVVNLITGLGFAYTGTGPRARTARWVISVMYRAVFAYQRQRVIVQNEDDLEELISSGGLRRKRSTVVPGSGVDIEQFSPVMTAEEPEPAPLVILPGRMLYDKGILDFVAAVAILRPRFPKARFALIGPTDDGNPAGVPQALLREWNANQQVEWWGPIPDIREGYRQACIVVLPSRREGMPKVVLEAAAFGLPVVTTAVPGCRESVIDGETGFVVPYGDPDALADRIGRLLESAELRRAYGRNARALAVERFAAPKIVRRMTETLMEIL